MSGTESFHVTLREAWEAAATAWSDYVRAGRDPFFHVSLAAFLELLPGPRGTTLDVGCGEGRVGAELAPRGYRVLGVELSPTLAARARERHEVVEADAAALPFEDATFPLVVSFNSLMDMDDAAGAVREAARVLEPGGRFCAAIVHSFLSAGSGEPFTIADSVVGLDASPTLLEFARQADPEGEYVLGDATALPFEDASFDLVVAYNSLMDVEDMAGAVAEAARVLEPGGRLCVSIVHPIVDMCRFEGDEPDAPFVFAAPYFERREYHGRFERAGLGMTFHGYVRLLEDYTRALEDAGFLLDALREPADPGADEQWRRIPNFLYLRAL